MTKKKKRRTVKKKATAAKKATVKKAKPRARKTTVPVIRRLNAAVGMSSIEFDKSSDSPELVRVSIKGEGTVLMPGASHGVTKPYPIGTRVDAQVEVSGNPGDTATIAVKHASRSSIVVPAPKGREVAIKTLTVTG